MSCFSFFLRGRLPLHLRHIKICKSYFTACDHLAPEDAALPADKVLTCEVEYTLDVDDRVLVVSLPAQKQKVGRREYSTSKDFGVYPVYTLALGFVDGRKLVSLQIVYVCVRCLNQT